MWATAQDNKHLAGAVWAVRGPRYCGILLPPLISAASPAAAITAANALAAARGAGVEAFSGTGWVTTDIATTPGGLHVDCVFDGDPINIRGMDRGGNPA